MTIYQSTTYRIRQLFSTLAVAIASNPVLLEGEKWLEKDATTLCATGRSKTGDGILSADKATVTGTAFNDLPFDPGVYGNLGTAASRDVPATGDASATQVVKGDDSRLSNARPWSAPVSTTYAASGAISTSDRIALINSASAAAMTLGSGATNGQVMVIKRLGAGSVTVTSNLDCVSNSTIVADSTTMKESVMLAWSASLSTWFIL